MQLRPVPLSHVQRRCTFATAEYGWYEREHATMPLAAASDLFALFGHRSLPESQSMREAALQRRRDGPEHLHRL